MYSFTSRYRYPEKGGPFPSRKQPNRGHPTSNQASFLQRLAIFLLFFLWYHTAPIGGSDTASYLQSSLSGFAPGGLRAVFIHARRLPRRPLAFIHARRPPRRPLAPARPSGTPPHGAAASTRLLRSRLASPGIAYSSGLLLPSDMASNTAFHRSCLQLRLSLRRRFHARDQGQNRPPGSLP